MSTNQNVKIFENGKQNVQNLKPSSYGFDSNYFRRFININKVLFPRLVSKTVGWILFLVVFRYEFSHLRKYL